MLAAAAAVGARRARALHARDDDRDERAAGAARRADGVRRDRGVRASSSTCAARTARTSTGSAPEHPTPLVPLERCVGVRGRIGPDGELAPLDLDTLPDLGDAEAIAVCLLFSFRDPLARAGRRRGAATAATRTRTSSPRTSPRPSSASTNARRRRPRTRTSALCSAATCGALAARCAEAGLPVPLVMRSSGGVAPLEEAAAHAARALLSGPAAGVVGAARVARLAGIENALAFDMGGTSTDVCAIVGGEATRSSERLVGGLPIRLPTARRAHGRRRRRLDRLARRRRRAPGRASERGRRAGTGLLRPRRRAADGHRREPPARPAAGPARRRPRARPRRRRAGAGVGRRGARRT